MWEGRRRIRLSSDRNFFSLFCAATSGHPIYLFSIDTRRDVEGVGEHSIRGFLFTFFIFVISFISVFLSLSVILLYLGFGVSAMRGVQVAKLVIFPVSEKRNGNNAPHQDIITKNQRTLTQTQTRRLLNKLLTPLFWEWIS